MFKDEHFKRIYVSMCCHLNLDKLVGRNQSPLNDILILIFEGYCIYFLAINASQYYNYIIEIPVMMEKLKNDPEIFLQGNPRQKSILTQNEHVVRSTNGSEKSVR